MSGDTSGNLLGLSVAVKLLEFAHTSAFVFVSRVCVQVMRKISSRSVSSVVGGARVTATRELQHDTSLRKFFVLGALVPAMLLATWWVRPPSMTGGVGNPTTAAKEHFHLSRLITHSFLGHCFRHSCSPSFSNVVSTKGSQTSSFLATT